MMRALTREVQTAIHAAVQGLLPAPKRDPHGRGRPRVPDSVCLHGIIIRLISGVSWETVEFFLDYKVSDTTLRARRDEWIKAGVFTKLVAEAQRAYDRIIGFDLAKVAVDGSCQRAPCGGPGTGVNPFDRGKLGWKWVMTVDAAGIPLGWVTDGANRNDFALLVPAMEATIENLEIAPIGKLALDRGFSYKCTPSRLASYDIDRLDMKPRQPAGQAQQLIGLGDSWIVESANSWFTNYGQLRRNTDRTIEARLAAIALTVTFIIIGRLIDHRNTHHRHFR